MTKDSWTIAYLWKNIYNLFESNQTVTKQALKMVQAICGSCLSDCNKIPIYNQLVCKRTPNLWPVWLNGQVFIYELSGCGFEPVTIT